MREPRPFEKVPMSSVPDPVNPKTTSSSLWPLFEALVALPPDEQFAIRAAIKHSGDANMMMNKLRKWGNEYHPNKRFVNNRSADARSIWIWWVPNE